MVEVNKNDSEYTYNSGLKDKWKTVVNEHDDLTNSKKVLLIDTLTGLPFSSTNRLPVEAQLVVEDIQIGAVEIQDAESGLRQNIKSDGIDNAAIVLINSRKSLEGLGNILVGTSEVSIDFAGTPVMIRMRADDTNTGLVYFGNAGVLSDGSNDFIRLAAGDEFTIDYNDTINGLFAISDSTNQKISGGALL
jgi:hypothetical protein